MTREETIDRLRDLERRIHELRVVADAPALERAMHVMELNCHVARWELGDIDALIPEAAPR